MTDFQFTMIIAWTKHFVLLCLLTAPQSCSSDFNIILPEICNLSGKVNLTWVRSMVELGIRDEQTQISLNIVGPEEICDGSKGLLKFISMAYADPQGQMIASLQPHLCPTAATFCHLNQGQFISWTCSKMPGVNSLKPPHFDVILAIQRMLRYFHWNNIALTKSRFDGSPYCDEIGAYLQNDSRNNDNLSVMILGNYEDLDQYEATSVTNNLDGLFLCISYDYGFTHNLSQKTELRGRSYSGHGQGNANRIPLVLLPEWPLPVEIFSPENPTLALVANTHPLTPTTSSFDFQPKSWDSVEADKENILPHKLLETLLAQMILKSVKISLEFERMERESATSSAPKNSHHNFHHQQQLFYFNANSPQQFLFSILQYEKARWHPLINLVHGEKYVTKHPSDRRSTSTETTPEDDQDFLFTWFKIVLSIFISGALLVVVVATTLHARNRAKRRAFYGTPNCRRLSRRHRSQGPYKIVLTSNDLTFGPAIVPDVPKKTTRSPFISTISSFQRSSQDKPDLLKGSFGTLRKNSSTTNLKNEAKIVGNVKNTARYKGDLVYLKRLVVSSESFEIKIKAMMVLETLHGLRHENLVAMLGCFTDGVPALVWEYCSRGSLHDIIKQSDIKLDWAFKLSLLTDLVRGMRYLHSSMVRVHGFLNSCNCVIDARWVLKITDYGIPAIFHTQGLAIPAKSPKDLLWTSPELLRDENLRRQGTQAADVYSFAIIMQEVLVRGEPYCMLTLTAEEILEKVKKPPPLIRPSVSKGAAPPEAINIMRQCWAELPDMRPDFMVIHDLFKTLNHGRKANIVDTMFQMLEKYSNNLEELIRERTEQLDLEKKKTEQLLNRMLPSTNFIISSTVAEKLKLGLPVDPEEFFEVTIYFSDIVGFTTISAYSTPFEVVDLLNDLYTCFDGTINDYNVYKVETIGDAYMVVGGAPIWSPDHADQIATMALDLLHQSGKFRIRHLPYTPLRLRIGLHTGSCCAGVVGLTMPRYCLFGDTVNTASRMESTGSAWRIHISGETKAKLDEVGGYMTEYRGITDIKGKGTMKTFWLLGKDGFDKILPTPPGLNDSISLDENSISYGRTGKMPPKSSEPSITVTRAKDNPCKGSAEGNLAGTSPHLKPKPGSYAFVTGESLRSLSPAEQVAHQLLNGRPTAKGLRRQLSLDQRTMPMMLQKAKQANFRRAPSLEENTDPISEIITNTVAVSVAVSTGNTNSISSSNCSSSSSSSAFPAPIAAPTMSSSPSQNSTSSTSSTTTTVKSVVVVTPCEVNVPSAKVVSASACTSSSDNGNTTEPTEETSGITTTNANTTSSCNTSTSLVNNKLKVNPRAGKLTKILSVVEESPVLDRRYNSVSTNHV